MKPAFILTALAIITLNVNAQQFTLDTPQRDASSLSRRLPDPRFRAPIGVEEIDHVASMVGKHTGQKTSGQVVLTNDSPFARITGPLDGGRIELNPRAAADIPPNSWAFIIGHEFAHRTHHLGNHGNTDPQQELRADIIGAQFAMAAGFDLAAHIAWTLTRPDRFSQTHGSPHARATRLGQHYNIPREAVHRAMARYRHAR